MVPDDLLWAWETAYRRYGEAAKAAALAISGDPNATQHMVSASREMAVAWRALEAVPDLPWWVLAAVSHAAQAFEFQAQDWNAQARRAWPQDVHGNKGRCGSCPPDLGRTPRLTVSGGDGAAVVGRAECRDADASA